MRTGALALASLIALIGCQAPPGDRPAVAVRLERLWSVGDSAGGQPLFGTLEFFQVASNGRDRIYALSRASFRVLVFDADGHLVDSIGRRGKGPGELADPWAITVDRTGTLNVTDLGRQLVSRWSAGAALLPPVPVADALDDPRVILNGDTVLLLTRGVTPQGEREFQLIEHSSAGRQVVARMPRVVRIGDFPSCQAAQITSAPLFTPSLLWSSNGDRVAIASGSSYKIEVRDRGAPVGTVAQLVEPIRATPALARAEAANWMINDCIVPPDEVVRGIGYQPDVPVVRSIVLSPAGALWVQRRTVSGAGDRIDRYSPDLSFAGSLPPGTPMPVAFLGEDRFAAIERDSLDVPALSLFRLH